MMLLFEAICILYELFEIVGTALLLCPGGAALLLRPLIFFAKIAEIVLRLKERLFHAPHAGIRPFPVLFQPELLVIELVQRPSQTEVGVLRFELLYLPFFLGKERLFLAKEIDDLLGVVGDEGFGLAIRIVGTFLVNGI